MSNPTDIRNSPSGKLKPAGGSASIEPHQQVRFLDTNFVGTPTGSIAEPFVDPDDFFAEVALPGGWALMLPADDVGDFNIPDLDGVPVALIGVMQTASAIGSIPIAAQNAVLTLRDLTAGTISFGAGLLTLSAENCTLNFVEASGTVTGTVRFVNCRLNSHINFPDAVVDWQDCNIGDSGGAARTIAIFGGTLRSCVFRANVTLQLLDVLTMYDCEFGAGFKIQCAAANAITCDPSTYARLVAAAPDFTDTTPQLIQKPRVLYCQQIGLVNGDIIPAAGTMQFDLGTLTANPSPLPGGLAQVQFLGQAGSTVVCVGATINGSGHVLVEVMNVNDLLTAEVENGQVFVVFYEPAELLTF